MGKLKGNARRQIQQVIGEVFAAQTGEDIYRIRDGILIETEEGDVVVKVILKKEEIEFTVDDILDTYQAKGLEVDEAIGEMVEQIDLVDEPVDAETPVAAATKELPLDEGEVDPLDATDAMVELEQ